MRKKSIFIVAIIFLSVGVFGQESVPQDQPVQEQKSPEFSYARLSFLDGRIFLQRASDMDYEEATINTPVGEGDRLGTTDGRAEVSFGGRKFARLNNNTKIDVQTLPRGESSLIRLRQWTGNLYIDLNLLDVEKSFEVLTAAATFYFLEAGTYRIDVGDDGRTEILVFSGLVEAAAADGSVLVKEGQRLSLIDGRFDDRPSSFSASSTDAFDEWNEERNALTHRPSADHNLPSDIVEYESELDAYGDWVDVDEFGYVWVPSAMPYDWRPYSLGRWTRLDPSGWCWVADEPWGWCTSHFGRWHWSPAYGWYWIPLSGWGLGWVNWWWDDFYYGWAPMSYWGYPGVIFHNGYYGHGWEGDYPYDSRALTVVRKDQLQAPNISRAALQPDEIRAIGRLSLTKANPSIRPGLQHNLKIEPLDGNGRVIIRKSGDGTLTRDEASKSLSREAGKASISSPRLIRSADRANSVKKSDSSADKSSAGRVTERTGKDKSAATEKSTERRIRKKEDGGSPEIAAYPSSSRISRENPENVSTSGSPLDKFYRYLRGDRTKDSSSGNSEKISGKNSSTKSSSDSKSSSSVKSNRSTSSSSRSSRSSSPRSGSSGRSSSRSSGSGSVRKK